jgi:DNA-3-methyladenine glycosylase I
MHRCPWTNDPLMNAYHDTEWGVPVHEDRRWFEDLVLDGAQAGLSWSTILKRREGYRAAFDGFDPVKVAAYAENDVARLLQDPGIIRNRLKIRSAIANAQAFLRIQKEFGSFDAYIWRFVDGKPIKNAWQTLSELPATSSVSDALSRDLKQRGFTFVGSTIVYALMQATGMVNDHLVSCFRYDEV